jgi:hypothetical protein
MDIIIPFSSSNNTPSRVTNGSRPSRLLLSFPLFPRHHTMCYMKGTQVIFHPPSPSTYPLNMELLKMFTSELCAPLTRLSHINHFNKSFVTSSLGSMKKCQVLTLILLYTKLRHTQVLDPSGRDFIWSTPIKQLLLSLKSKKLLNMALFIMWL